MSIDETLKDNFPIKDPLPELFLAIDAATKAGKIVMNIYNKDFQASSKSDNEPITEADIQSNKLIQKYNLIHLSTGDLFRIHLNNKTKKLYIQIFINYRLIIFQHIFLRIKIKI